MAIAAEAYDTIYARAQLRYRLALADGVSAAIAPFRCSGFVTENEPDLVSAAIRPFLKKGSQSAVLMDLGCGTGLLGAAVAERLNLNVTGCDFSTTAIQLARTFVPTGRFAVATFDRLPFRNRSIGALISHDALYLGATDDALSEIARVLCDGGPIVFSTYLSSGAATWPLSIWRDKLREHGLQFLSARDDTQRWRRVMRRRHRARWRQRDRLISVLGADVIPEIAVSARMIGADGQTPFIAMTSRFLITACRAASGAESKGDG